MKSRLNPPTAPQTPEEVRQLALRRLDKREYSSAEMIRYLVMRGADSSEASEVVKSLVEAGLIDDRRYAKALARWQALRGKGSRYIQNKLREKGVALDLAEVTSLVTEVSGVSELEAARRIVERRYPDCQKDRSEAGRAFQALIRRGFSYEIARAAVTPAKKH